MMLDRGRRRRQPFEHLSRAQGRRPHRCPLPTPSHKGKGFVQPLAPHDHWHVDFSYMNIAGTFYYLCSRARRLLPLHRRLGHAPADGGGDAEIVMQRAREALSGGTAAHHLRSAAAQFIARDFKEFIRLWQTTSRLSSPHYPQSNGKLERFHRTLKEQAIRPKTPLCLEDARRIVGEFIEHYNTIRLHSAIGYITPADRLAGRHIEIFAARDKSSKQPEKTAKLNDNKNTPE